MKTGRQPGLPEGHLADHHEVQEAWQQRHFRNVPQQLLQRFKGDERWNSIDSPQGEIFDWQDDSTYIQNPPYFRGMTLELPGIPTIKGARCLAKLGDSITTDHISPAGAIKEDSPAGEYLKSKGVQRADFNSYGSRRGITRS